MENKFKYDAFISYRHTELDKFVAENLHKQLEAFRLPKSAIKKNKKEKSRIERVFRDKDELPLTSNLEDPIVQALHNSEWLIVVCSPRLRESLWCRKEIETFVALRGREHVLAVLIEGEPSESFPDELLYRTETRTLPGGTVEEVKIPVEPLAADVRGKTKKDMLKAMKTEILRLLATMFGVEYDDLRQRHREQKMRRIVTASLIGGAACLLFGVFSTATALRIQRQKEQIEAQSAEIQAQSEEIQKQSEEIQARNDELALRQAYSLAERASQSLEEGDRIGAIQTALEALTESEGITLPYTSDAQLVLADSLRLYDTGDVYKADFQVETAGEVEDVMLSPFWNALAIYDSTGALTIFDLDKKELVTIIGSTEYDKYAFNGFTFLGENQFAYVNTQKEICIFDMAGRDIVKRISPEQVSRIYSDKRGCYLLVESWECNYTVYDGKTFEELGTTPLVETNSYVAGPYVFSDGTMVCGYTSGQTYGSQEYTLHFINLNTMETMSSCNIGINIPESIEVKDGIAYVACIRYSDNMMESDGYLCAVDMASGNLVWDYEQKGYYGIEVNLPANEGAKYLSFMTEGNAVLIDMKTGEASFTVSMPSLISESNTYQNTNSFLVICKDGEMFYVDAEAGTSRDMSHMFECKTTSNLKILNYSQGIVVAGKNDNRVTVYTKQVGPGMVKTDTAYELPQSDHMVSDEEISKIANEYGFESPDFIDILYYDETKKYCFVYYEDYSFLVYDVEAGEVVKTLDWAYPTWYCQGTDKQGYTYLLGYYGCYVLNEKMEPIMWIPEAVEVDMDNQKVYLSKNYNCFEAPIYTLDELIEMAESYKVK